MIAPRASADDIRLLCNSVLGTLNALNLRSAHCPKHLASYAVPRLFALRGIGEAHSAIAERWLKSVWVRRWSDFVQPQHGIRIGSVGRIGRQKWVTDKCWPATLQHNAIQEDEEGEGEEEDDDKDRDVDEEEEEEEEEEQEQEQEQEEDDDAETEEEEEGRGCARREGAGGEGGREGGEAEGNNNGGAVSVCCTRLHHNIIRLRTDEKAD